MKRALITALIATTGALATAATPAGAEPPAGTQCQQAGLATLQELGLLTTVAKGGIEVVGVGVLPLRTVLSLHRNEPELFQTDGVSVVVPTGIVAATWCDGL